MAGFCVLAKLLDALDASFESAHIVTGHTLKHLAAAGASHWMLLRRRPIDAID